MVLRIAEILGMGLRDANDLLHAARPTGGLSDRPLHGADLAAYRAVLDRMLTAHEPYPGLVLDGHWTVVTANGPAWPCSARRSWAATSSATP